MASTAEEAFSKDFARSLRLSRQDEDTGRSDPAFLIRSASAPPTDSINSIINNSNNGMHPPQQQFHEQPQRHQSSSSILLDPYSTTSSASSSSTSSGAGPASSTSSSKENGTGKSTNSSGSGSSGVSQQQYQQQMQQQMYEQQMYQQYIPSPGLHPMATYFVPPSPHMYPTSAQDVLGVNTSSPYLGPASYSASPAQFDYYGLSQAPTNSPALTHLLPQSLFGTPPTFGKRDDYQTMAGLQQQYSPALGPYYAAAAASANSASAATMSAAAAAASQHHVQHHAHHQHHHSRHHHPHHQHDSHHHHQQQQQGHHHVPLHPSMHGAAAAAAAASQYQMHHHMPQYYQTQFTASPTMMMAAPPPLQMPHIQMPPAAQQTQHTSPTVARYLSNQEKATSPSAGGGSNDWGSPSGSDGTTPSSRSSPTMGNSKSSVALQQNASASVGGNTVEDSMVSPRNSVPSVNTSAAGGGSLLEELRSKMTPSNAGNGNNNNGGRKNSNQNKAKSPSGNVTWGLRQIEGQVVTFAKDQHGSRFIQQQLESPTVPAQDKEMLFKEILPYASVLSVDLFGNYVIQKLLDSKYSSPAVQESLVTTAIQGNMFSLSTNVFACRIIQKLIEKVFGKEGEPLKKHFANNKNLPGALLYDVTYQDSLIMELSPHVMECVTDQNANHVIQKCIEQIRPISRIQFILDSFRGNMSAMAKHAYGCRCIQRLIENCPLDISDCLSELLDNVEDLVTDQFGNYCIQHLISSDNFPEERKRLMTAVKDNILKFSTHKFASNVVESCLQRGTAEERRALIGTMLKVDKTSGRCPLEQMTVDAFANYVVQKAISIAQDDQHQRIVQLVKQNASALRKLTYGKHILSKIAKDSH